MLYNVKQNEASYRTSVCGNWSVQDVEDSELPLALLACTYFLTHVLLFSDSWGWRRWRRGERNGRTERERVGGRSYCSALILQKVGLHREDAGGGGVVALERWLSPTPPHLYPFLLQRPSTHNWGDWAEAKRKEKCLSSCSWCWWLLSFCPLAS